MSSQARKPRPVKLPDTQEVDPEVEDDFFMAKPVVRPSLARPRPKAKPAAQPKKKRKTEDDHSDSLTPPVRKGKGKASQAALGTDSDSDASPGLRSTASPAPTKKRIVPRPLTPPPSLPSTSQSSAATQSARRPAPAASAALDLDDYEDFDIDLPPELAEIAMRVAKEARDRPSVPQDHNALGEVRLTVTMKVSPSVVINDSNRQGIRVYETPFDITLGYLDSFDRVQSKAAAKKGHSKNEVVLVHNNKRIWPATTPQSLQLHGHVDIIGYKKDVYDEVVRLQERRYEAFEEPEPELEIEEDIEIVEEVKPKESGMQLMVRAKDGQSFTCGVKAKTTMAKILKAALTEFGQLNLLSRAHLEFDHEELESNQTVGEVEDLEDGFTLDLVVQ